MRDLYYPKLLPMMCLNRYYLAEGVKLYSQDTWKQVVQDKGKEYVLQFLPSFVEFYISQIKADNHAVREAACHSIAELCNKIAPLGKEKMKSYIVPLLNALMDGLKDQSWPVRDSACLASGEFAMAFPEESLTQFDTLFNIWIHHLSDNISTVRENSAIGLGHGAKAFGEKGQEKCFNA